MQTTYRIKAQEISMTFLKSLKSLFAGQEVEITVKSVAEVEKPVVNVKSELLEMIKRNRESAPTIAMDIDIRGLIDSSQHPA